MMNMRRLGAVLLMIARGGVAIVAGIVTVVALSLGTDFALEHSILPAMGSPHAPPSLLALALIYRTVYGVLGGYVTARLAPAQPMIHALILAAIGTYAAVKGIYMMWDYGNHWYPIALAVLALPQSWVGARLAGGR